MGIQWERKEQAWLVQWFRLKFPDKLIVASANGGSRNAKEAVNLKREGVLAGAPDLVIYCARRGYHGLFIELKDPGSSERAKGRLSTVQGNMLNRLNAEGYYAVCCWGWLQAKEVINWYLGEDVVNPSVK
jgi:hypothetical protein